MAKIIDNFILIETLGQGNFSETLKGRNLVSKSPVAVKTIKLDQFLSNQVLREMVINEIQILKRLDDIKIVQMLKMLKSSNNIYLIYEFLNGGKISTFITNEGIPLEKALRYFKQMAEALVFVHKQGLFHNNISTETFYLCDEQIKLKNFLSAKSLEIPLKKNIEPEIMRFSSPEILMNKEGIGFKSDVYSLGLTFYETLMGKSLYEGVSNEKDSVLEKLNAFSKEKTLEKKEIWPENITNELRELLKKMLKIEENERIGLNEVYSEICGFLSEKPKNEERIIEEKTEEKPEISNKKFDKFMMKERNKVLFILQNVGKIVNFPNLIINFPRNLLVLSLLKIGLLGLNGLESVFSEGNCRFSKENFMFNSNTIDINEGKSWISSDFARFFLRTIREERGNLKEIITNFSKEDVLKAEIQNLGLFGLDFFKNEAENGEIHDEKILMKWLFSFSFKIYEVLSKQKENEAISDENDRKEQGILANYLLDVVFFKEFFENFIKNDGKLQEQKYFKHVEGVNLEKLQGMLEKKLTYAKKQLNL